MNTMLLLLVVPPIAAPGWPVMGVVGLLALALAAVVYKVGKERR